MEVRGNTNISTYLCERSDHGLIEAHSMNKKQNNNILRDL